MKSYIIRKVNYFTPTGHPVPYYLIIHYQGFILFKRQFKRRLFSFRYPKNHFHLLGFRFSFSRVYGLHEMSMLKKSIVNYDRYFSNHWHGWPVERPVYKTIGRALH